MLPEATTSGEDTEVRCVIINLKETRGSIPTHVDISPSSWVMCTVLIDNQDSRVTNLEGGGLIIETWILDAQVSPVLFGLAFFIAEGFILSSLELVSEDGSAPRANIWFLHEGSPELGLVVV